MPRKPSTHGKCGDYGCRSKSTGQPCKNAAGMRTQHLGVGPCWMHGGNVPNGQAKWRRMLAEKEARKLLAKTYGANDPRMIDPLSALKEELYRAAGIVAWLEGQVESLGEAEVTHMTVVFEADGKPAVHGEHTNEMIKLLQQERRLLLDVVKTCLSFGIAQQEIAIAKDQAAIFNQTLRAILIETGVDVTRPEVIAVVRKHITAAAVANAA